MTVLWQGDKRWGKAKLGEGGSTIGKAGCLITCLAQAQRFLGIDANATPLTVQERAFAAGGRPFVGAGAVVDAVAIANGLVSGARVNEVEGQAKLRTTIEEAIARGHVVLLHVDHDVDRGGDWDADHWVLGTSIVRGGVDAALGKNFDDAVVYADPATAAESALSLRTLTGATRWGDKPRTYRVRGVRVLAKA